MEWEERNLGERVCRSAKFYDYSLAPIFPGKLTIKAILTDPLVHFGQLSALRTFSPSCAVLELES